MATQTELDEARAAYHQLVTGRAARVVIDQNGEKVEFVAANRAQLALYIGQLEAALNVGPARVIGPAGFVF